MQGSIFDYWQAIVGLVAVIGTVIGTVIAWQRWRKPGTDTTNIAEGSSRVKQSGGPGTTRNEARNSEDVDQSG